MKKYPKEAELECPTCQGRGFLKVTANHGLRYFQKYSSTRDKIRRLGKKKVYKMTLRDLAEELGFKRESPQQARHHVNMVEKLGWENFGI